jgi:hypothetical protein
VPEVLLDKRGGWQAESMRQLALLTGTGNSRMKQFCDINLVHRTALYAGLLPLSPSPVSTHLEQ